MVIVEPELPPDDQGLFARGWCREEFAAHGFNGALAQRDLCVTSSEGPSAASAAMARRAPRW